MTGKADDFVFTKAQFKDADGVDTVANYIKQKSGDKNVVFFCIGTDRSTGDSFGPWVGTMLQEKGYTVIGTLEHPVHATNIFERVAEIPRDSFVVAVDAVLGRIDSVGTISVRNGALKPGVGVGKNNLPEVGDVAVKGCVNVGGFMEFAVLQSTNLWRVWKMAESFSEAIQKNVTLEKGSELLDVVNQ